MKLILSWNDFKSQVCKQIKVGTSLKDKLANIVSQKNNIEDLSNDYKIWKDEVNNLLKTSFDSDNNSFAINFIQAGRNKFDLGFEKDIRRHINDLQDDLFNKLRILKYNLKLLSICDTIIGKQSKKTPSSTDEIIDFILDKLYEVYDNYFYEVKKILDGNGVYLNRNREEFEIAELLVDYGYVESNPGSKNYIRLSLEGKIYIEEKRKKIIPNYSKISDSNKEVIEKIDQIAYDIKMQGFGQEIIFNELEELKKELGVLDKRNWGQLLKGKLIDLLLGQFINEDVAKSIYLEITNEIIKLNKL